MFPTNSQCWNGYDDDNDGVNCEWVELHRPKQKHTFWYGMHMQNRKTVFHCFSEKHEHGILYFEQSENKTHLPGPCVRICLICMHARSCVKLQSCLPYTPHLFLKYFFKLWWETAAENRGFMTLNQNAWAIHQNQQINIWPGSNKHKVNTTHQSARAVSERFGAFCRSSG